MKEKLKKIDIRLTELSTYLEISRPTLYKYIEDYEKRKYKSIDPMALDVFRFINKKDTVSKLQVINHIIQLQKNQMGMTTDLIQVIEKIVIDDNRGDELTELIKLFEIKESSKIIDEIIEKYIRGE